MDISVIVPLYNEAESLPELTAWIERVMEENKFSYEIWFINDGGILVENFQHGVAELVLVLFTAYLHLHARLQGKVVLRLDVVVHQHHAVGQQGFYARTADAVHLLHKELHQFRRFIDRIDCIFGCGTRNRASAVVARVISCHFVASVKS